MSISLWILIRPETSGVVLSAGDQSWPEEMEEGGGKEGREEEGKGGRGERGERGGEEKGGREEEKRQMRDETERERRKKEEKKEYLQFLPLRLYTHIVQVCFENLTNIGVAYNSCNQCQFL